MTLVCVAPDGSLEVWEMVISEPNSYSWRMETDLFITKGLAMTPQFWGREVIGEL